MRRPSRLMGNTPHPSYPIPFGVGRHHHRSQRRLESASWEDWRREGFGPPGVTLEWRREGVRSGSG